MTPVFKLSGTSRAGTPAKNSNAATWHATQVRWFIDSTGRTNACREQARTITKAHTRRARSRLVASGAPDARHGGLASNVRAITSKVRSRRASDDPAEATFAPRNAA